MFFSGISDIINRISNIEEHTSRKKVKNTLDFKHYKKTFSMIFGSNNNINRYDPVDAKHDNYQIMRSNSNSNGLLKMSREFNDDNQIGMYHKTSKILDSILDLMTTKELFINDGIDIHKVTRNILIV